MSFERGELMMGNFIKDESGQGLVEYVFIMILIAVMLIAVLEILGGSLDNRLNGISSQISEA